MSHICHFCKKTYSSLSGLQYHIDNNVCTKKCNKYKCINCNKILSNATAYQYHIEHNVCKNTDIPIPIPIPKPKIKISLNTVPILNIHKMHDNFKIMTFADYQQMYVENIKLKTQINHPDNIISPVLLLKSSDLYAINQSPTLISSTTINQNLTDFEQLSKNISDSSKLNSTPIENNNERNVKIFDGKQFNKIPIKDMITQIFLNQQKLLNSQIRHN